MKRLSFLCFSLLAIQSTYCQSQLLNQGVLKPVNGKSIVIEPSTKSEIYSTTLNKSTNPKNTIQNDGSPNLLSGNSEIYSNNNDNSLLSLTGNNTSKNAKIQNSSSQSTSLNNELAPLISNTSTSNKTIAQSINNENKTTNKPLEPLTYIPLNTPKKNLTETIDPSRINKEPSLVSNFSKPVYNSTLIKNKTETVGPRSLSSNNSLAMIDLAPISSNDGNYKANNSGMPELAPIPFSSKSNNISVMPELAPIVGIEIKSDEKKPSIVMPELAPLEDNLNTKELGGNVNSKIDSKPRGFIVPAGTLLKATDSKTYILKPISTQQDIEQDGANLQTYKPSAGGGIGLILEDENVIEYIGIQNNNQTQPTKQELELAAKKHKHDPNNPCCKVQMYYANSPKKVIKKKKYTPKKTTPTVYTYKQDPVQTKNIERIVYVPVQSTQQYQQPKQETYKPSQTVVQVNQPRERVVYRDYTNAYTKQAPPNTSSNCNCPGTNAQQKNTSNDPKAYYNVNNYANGLNAGPTSGDYPMNNKSSEADMKYTFYVNPRGKYGVSLYNSFCSVLLSQNGKVVEFKEYGDPNQPKPRLNYFGSPESIGGIPIEYNYNRSVHKIGNIVLDYDFEGFFKTVGSSNVFYTSRSSLSKVDNVNVRYDGMGNVTNVDQNDGLIKYNPWLTKIQ